MRILIHASVILAVLGATATEGPGVPEIPVPCNGMTIGLPAALSAMERFVLRFPNACGLNVTCTVQLAPVASVPPPWPFPQLVVKGKSAEEVIELKVNVDPLLVIVTG